jgi:dTDP-glucose pyrophosphorylase
MEKYLIKKTSTIRDALKMMDKGAIKTLYAHQEKKLLGSISDGDIRRAILANMPLERKISDIMNINPCVVFRDTDNQKIKILFIKNKFESIPIIDNKNIIIDIITWNNFFSDENTSSYDSLNNEVVIMAGGKGTRMKPFTNIFPKPLIPVGEKTMVEVIMDEFKKYSIENFYFTVNYKKELLKAFFEKNCQYNISFIDETEFNGTASSIKLIQHKFEKPFFVANCDILIKCDYADIVKFHDKGHYDITIVASLKHFQIPYGVCEIESGGNLMKIDEKPQYDYLVNTGLYLLNPDVIQYIPSNEFFHMTHLIEKLKSVGKQIGVFPVSEKSWFDIGQWNEYRENIKLFE